MRILIDILHPAHVHFFKGFRQEMLARGHEVLVTARAKDVTLSLLDRLQIPYESLSQQRSGAGLAVEMLTRTARLSKVARRFRPDIMTGIMGPSIAVAGKLLRIPSVVFYDTEFAKQTNWFVYPLAAAVCTPDCYQGRVQGNHVTYAGYHELAYLHPNRFVPDPERLKSFGVSAGDPYSVVRFVSWEASHDVNEIGLTLDQKIQLIDRLKGVGRVIITSEAPLPADLEEHRLKGPVDDVHHLLAYAQILVGESATMASEAAVLGTPAVYIATTGRGYTDDQEARYGIVRSFTEAEFDQACAELDRILQPEVLQTLGSRARRELLREKIDVTGWMLNFFEDRFAL